MPGRLLVLALENSEAMQSELTNLMQEAQNEENEERIRDLRRHVFACFKFIAEMAYRGFIPITVIQEVLSTLLSDFKTFMAFGKVVLIFCGV